MNFNADQVGRHMLYFVVNNQPSNVVVVDVFAQAQAGGNLYAPNSQTAIPNGMTTTTSNGQTTTTASGTGTTVTSSYSRIQ